MKKSLTARWIVGTACAVVAGVIFMGKPLISYAYTQATGIISADAANVRKEPNTGSDTVKGLLKGSTVTVTDEITDSAGTRWYQVLVEGETGYVRSDLLIKSTTATGTTTENVTINNTAAETTSKPQATTATAIAETKAYVSTSSARVREGATTEHELKGSVTENTPVTITGEAKGTDGKKWYQIKYNNANGNEVIGFVRADLVTVGEPPAQAPAEPVAEEPAAAEGDAALTEGDGAAAEGEVPAEVPEEPAEPEPVPEEKPDYEMRFEANAEGVNEWWLYDNTDNTRQTLAGLKAAAAAGVEGNQEDAKLISTQRIIIIVLAAIVVILVIVTTLLLFKMRDRYDDDDEYDDDEDEEEEEDEEDEEDEDDEEEEEPVRRKAITPFNKAKNKTAAEAPKKAEVKRMPVREEPEQEDEPEPEPAPQKAAPGKTAPPSRKAKNFLIDDDEFEFEFLNMDDRE